MTRHSTKKMTKNNVSPRRSTRLADQSMSHIPLTSAKIDTKKSKKRSQKYSDFIISSNNLPKINITKFKANALRENYLDDLVKNYDNRPTPSEFLDLYEIKEEYRKVRNQKRSPTCWIYALISYYETIFNKEYLKNEEEEQENNGNQQKNNRNNDKQTGKKKEKHRKIEPNTKKVIKTRVAHLSENEKFSFSPKYVFFFHIYEQSNKCLNKVRYHIHNNTHRLHDDFIEVLFNPIAYGGYEDDFTMITHKYGLVPETEYPSSLHSWDTYELEQTCTSLLKMAFHEMINSRKTKHDEIHQKTLQSMFHTLVMFLGEPPKKVSLWRENLKVDNITPLEFYQKYSPIKTDELAVLIHRNDKSDGVYKPHENWRNTTKQENTNGFEKRLNLRYRYISNYIKQSIDNQIPVPFGCDVSRDHDIYKGYSDVSLYQFYEYLEIPFEVSRKSVFNTFDRWGPHAMTIVGYYVDKRDPNKEIVMWKVMNSWGQGVGKEGFTDMKAEWMEFNSMFFHVDKSLLSEAHLDMWENSTPQKMEKNDFFQ